MAFERKKIQIDTLGEYLSEIRQRLNLSIKEVSVTTGISEKFIESLEKGDFCKLPADVYAMGFLKQLSLTYHISLGQLIEQYKKEKSIYKHLQKAENSVAQSKASKVFSRIVITPKILSLSGGLFFIGITIFYIVWQVVSLNQAPALEIFEPTFGQVYKTSFVSVKGKTDIGGMVNVNDQPVFVDENGIFQTQIGVNNGPKDVVIVAKNKFENTTKKTISINIEIQNSQLVKGLDLILFFTDEVVLKVSTDEGRSVEEVFLKNDKKIIKAKNKIVISTSNAGATEAELNGKKLGLLGRKGEELKDIPFFVENDNINEK